MDRAEPSVLVRPSLFAHCALYTLISESGQHREVSLTHLENGARIHVTLPPQRAAHVLLARDSGAVLGQLLPS
jgi:hypothetical protein